MTKLSLIIGSAILAAAFIPGLVFGAGTTSSSGAGVTSSSGASMNVGSGVGIGNGTAGTAAGASINSSTNSGAMGNAAGLNNDNYNNSNSGSTDTRYSGRGQKTCVNGDNSPGCNGSGISPQGAPTANSSIRGSGSINSNTYTR